MSSKANQTAGIEDAGARQAFEKALAEHFGLSWNEHKKATNRSALAKALDVRVGNGGERFFDSVHTLRRALAGEKVSLTFLQQLFACFEEDDSWPRHLKLAKLLGKQGYPPQTLSPSLCHTEIKPTQVNDSHANLWVEVKFGDASLSNDGMRYIVSLKGADIHLDWQNLNLVAESDGTDAPGRDTHSQYYPNWKTGEHFKANVIKAGSNFKLGWQLRSDSAAPLRDSIDMQMSRADFLSEETGLLPYLEIFVTASASWIQIEDVQVDESDKALRSLVERAIAKKAREKISQLGDYYLVAAHCTTFIADDLQ